MPCTLFPYLFHIFEHLNVKMQINKNIFSAA